MEPEKEQWQFVFCNQAFKSLRSKFILCETKGSHSFTEVVSEVSTRAVLILLFHFWYDTDIPALHISRYRYQHDMDDLYFDFQFCSAAFYEGVYFGDFR